MSRRLLGIDESVGQRPPRTVWKLAAGTSQVLPQKELPTVELLSGQKEEKWYLECHFKAATVSRRARLPMRFLLVLTLFPIFLLSIASRLGAQEWWEGSPIRYSESSPSECIARLQARIEAGEWAPDDRDEKAYVRSLLAELRVPVASQLLVFSKTSFQNDRIGPRSPRSIWFSENCYIGWVPGGAIEVASIDPELGPVFWILDPRKKESKPQFERERSCLSCHGGPKTGDVPGVLVRSVVPDADGFPILSERTYVTTHESPLEERWGGWYVTGTHGDHRHLGNVTAPRDGDQSGAMDVEAGANVTSLEGRFPLDRYLAPTSDIVALMVLEHQTAVQNAITRAQYGTRRAILRQRDLERALGEDPSGDLSGSSLTAVEVLAEDVLDKLLFKDEASLRGSRIEGSPGFEEAFQALRRPDRNDRALRDLQLRTRLFRYRLSYMIHSESFKALPVEIRAIIWRRLDRVLGGTDPSGRYDYLGTSECEYIREILLDTEPDAVKFWGRDLGRGDD